MEIMICVTKHGSELILIFYKWSNLYIMIFMVLFMQHNEILHFHFVVHNVLVGLYDVMLISNMIQNGNHDPYPY